MLRIKRYMQPSKRGAIEFQYLRNKEIAVTSDTENRIIGNGKNRENSCQISVELAGVLFFVEKHIT